MLLIHDDLVRAEMAHRHEVLLGEVRAHRLAVAARAVRAADRQARRARRLVARAILADR